MYIKLFDLCGCICCTPKLPTISKSEYIIASYGLQLYQKCYQSNTHLPNTFRVSPGVLS